MLQNLGRLENSVYKTYWNDGLLDLLAAIGVLAVGLLWLWDRPVFAAIVPPLLVPLWGPGRQWFIEPRLGTVEFTDDRESRNRRLLWLTLAAGTCCFVVAVALYLARDSFGAGPDVEFIAGLPAFLVAGLATLTAVLVASMRFMAYALVLVVAGVAGAVGHWSPGRILVVAGFVILVSSVAVLGRFLYRNPAVAGSNE